MSGVDEQAQFVIELSDRIRDAAVGYIKSGKVPANWNGLELRTLLHRMHADAVKEMGKQRLSDFDNHCLVHNL